MNPAPPEDLKGPAQAHWIRLYGVLNGMGVLQEQDRTVLRILCILLARFDEAVAEGVPENIDPEKVEGYLRGLDGRVDKLAARIESLCKGFGLTPSSRSNISVTAKNKPDTKRKFLKLGGGA